MGEKTEETTELLERVSTKEDDGQLDVKSLIYVVRGQQVMLDSDLAEIYGEVTFCDFTKILVLFRTGRWSS